MLKLVLLLAVVGVGVQGCEMHNTIDWCAMQQQFCDGREHIACEPNTFKIAGDDVRNIQQVPMTADMKKMLVDRHNMYRRRVALGEESKLACASKMRQMTWDDNLAYTADAHAKHARYDHDSCHGFTDFPQSGQNLAGYFVTHPYANLTETAQNLVDVLYTGEMIALRDDAPSCIEKFSGSLECPRYGHFTIIVKDSNRALGCAVYTFDKKYNGDWWYAILLTCNYGDNNIMDAPIYAKGEPCSECTGACNNGLCA
ncbi:hypothetical protein DMENIID0001_171500 [Sergentomyia squamirostris]